MIIVAVMGSKNSGKTTVTEYIIRSLTERGYSVGAAKHIHHEFTIDTEGKDTWRMSSAGAKVVVSSAPREVAIIKKTSEGPGSMDKILAPIKDEGLGVAILEGFHHLIGTSPDVHKVVTGRSMDDVERFMQGIAPPILAISGVAAAQFDRDSTHGIPVVDVLKDGPKLIKIIEERAFLSSLRT